LKTAPAVSAGATQATERSLPDRAWGRGSERVRPLDCRWSSDAWSSTAAAPAGFPGRSADHRLGVGDLVGEALLRQFVKQRLCLFQIARIEPFGKPAVDRSEKLASFPACPDRARAAPCTLQHGVGALSRSGARLPLDPYGSFPPPPHALQLSLERRLLGPHLVQRARCRSRSLDVSASHRTISGTRAIGAWCKHFSQ
jgi:hypothetical protein